MLSSCSGVDKNRSCTCDVISYIFLRCDHAMSIALHYAKSWRPLRVCAQALYYTILIRLGRFANTQFGVRVTVSPSVSALYRYFKVVARPPEAGLSCNITIKRKFFSLSKSAFGIDCEYHCGMLRMWRRSMTSMYVCACRNVPCSVKVSGIPHKSQRWSWIQQLLINDAIIVWCPNRTLQKISFKALGAGLRCFKLICWRHWLRYRLNRNFLRLWGGARV